MIVSADVSTGSLHFHLLFLITIKAAAPCSRFMNHMVQSRRLIQLKGLFEDVRWIFKEGESEAFVQISLDTFENP